MDFFSRWDLVLGIFSLIFFPFLPYLISFVTSQLPSRRIKYLFDLLDDADALFSSCSEQGLMVGQESLEHRLTLDK